MQTKFTKYFNYTLIITMLCVISAGMLFTSCDKEEEGDNGVTVLNSFGPMPVARGAELRFIGKNLDKVTAIVLPGNIEIPATEFGSKTATLVTITVPQNAIEGFIVVKSPDGDITTKTPLGFSEPISIATFSPAVIKQDSVLTITGDYLNLVTEVIFTDRIVVSEANFISHTRYEISLAVPAEAQTGKISVSNGAEDPIIVYSATNLTVKLPAISAINPNPVKAGTQLTISGNHLDIVAKVILGGGVTVTAFSDESTINQLIFTVPDNAEKGNVILQPASGVSVESATALVMVKPTVNVNPTTLKNGEDITVTGTNLDLVDKVIFGGGKEATIMAGRTATQIVATAPNDAISGIVKFTTKSRDTVSGPSLTLIDPVFTSFAPSSAKPKTDIVITGTDLDLVTDVIFVGDIKGTIGTRTLTQLTVTIPVGAKTGKITLVTKNGRQILSPTDITVLSNLPNISSFTEASGVRGKILTINGTNMSLIKQLVFPGDVVATDYGLKSDTKVEVYVPTNALTGLGTIKIFTYEGDEGLSPEIFISGTDPVVNSALTFFDFDAGDAGIGWKDLGDVEEDAALAISGKYYRVNAAVDGGWKVYFARNWGKFSTTGVVASTYAVRMDINILSPVASGVVLKFRMKGSDADYWYVWKIGELFPNGTKGWITVSLPLTGFKDNDGNGNPISNPSTLGSEYGITSGWGAGTVNMCVDNVRFELPN